MVNANFFYELGVLKRVKRSGWWIINVKDPESVADHSFRAGVIAYILARMENLSIERAHYVSFMTLCNDLHETRLNDLHKIGHRYIDFRAAETVAHKEQTEPLGTTGKEIYVLHEELKVQKTKESIIARDADLLECFAQAREYQKNGHDAQDWMTNIHKLLVTGSAKKLAKELEKTDPNDWWQGLKKSER
ncbi:MAG TPA: HD domain-containing protein [Candidatus Nanoarchaeia archaeon]|nr:HD domain-containing protein [Candidatus Nanoarchaeia archaeon]